MTIGEDCHRTVSDNVKDVNQLQSRAKGIWYSPRSTKLASDNTTKRFNGSSSFAMCLEFLRGCCTTSFVANRGIGCPTGLMPSSSQQTDLVLLYVMPKGVVDRLKSVQTCCRCHIIHIFCLPQRLTEFNLRQA